MRDDAVELRRREFDLLAFLCSSPRQVFTREQLLRHVWDSEPEWQGIGTVSEHVHRLRAKVEVDPAQAVSHPHRARRRLPLRPVATQVASLQRVLHVERRNLVQCASGGAVEGEVHRVEELGAVERLGHERRAAQRRRARGHEPRHEQHARASATSS